MHSNRSSLAGPAAALLTVVFTLGGGQSLASGSTSAAKAAVADIARDTGKQTEQALRPKEKTTDDTEAGKDDDKASETESHSDEPSHY